jgi:hypothetical protein
MRKQGETFRTATDSTGTFYLAGQHLGKVLALDAEWKNIVGRGSLNPALLWKAYFLQIRRICHYRQGTRWTVLLLDKTAGKYGVKIARKDLGCDSHFLPRDNVYLIVGGDQPAGIMIVDAKGKMVFFSGNARVSYLEIRVR